MVVGRQQLILEIIEKLLAGLALGWGGPEFWAAIVPLVHRKEMTNAREALIREICVLFAYAGAWTITERVSIGEYGAIGALLGSFLLMGTSKMHLKAVDWNGARLRNLLGFTALGFGLWGYDGRVVEWAPLAVSGAAVHFLFVKRNGEPGLLIPGCLLLMTGVLLRSAPLAGFGFGLLLPSAYLIGRNMGGAWLYRALACTLGACLGMLAGGRYSVWALVLMFVLSLETWRFALRWLVLSILMVLYRFRIHGEENVPYKGPAVLIGNHVSLLDGFLIAAHTQRLARFLVYDAYFKNPLMRFGLNLFRTIPISQGGKRDMIESLREARRRIEEGHVAGIFPEGSVTRSGFFNAYQKGITRVVQGAALPIIPAYMNGLWMSFVSFSEGGFQLTLPRRHRDLEIEYGEPIESNATHAQLWAKVKALEVKAAFRDSSRSEVLPLAFLHASRKYSSQIAVRDAQRELTYGELALDALLWARHMSKRWGSKRRVAVLLPMGIERVTAYAALALAGQAAIEFPREHSGGFDAFLRENRIGAVISSQAELAALGIAEGEEVLLVERLKSSATPKRRAKFRWILRFSPKSAWKRSCSQKVRRDSLAMLTQSGDAWIPLSFRGLQAAAHAARRVLWIKPGTTVRSSTSWESSAAFALGMWTPLLHGATIAGEGIDADFEIRHAADPAPLSEAGQILLIETPMHTGADAPNVYPVLEAAELSGIAALSAPPVTVAGDTQGGAKPGYVGRLPFGVEARIENGKTYFRSPQRRLPDEGDPRPGEWVATSIQGVADFGEVERVSISTSATHTS